jgi:hypothetical protein
MMVFVVPLTFFVRFHFSALCAVDKELLWKVDVAKSDPLSPSGAINPAPATPSADATK